MKSHLIYDINRIDFQLFVISEQLKKGDDNMANNLVDKTEKDFESIKHTDENGDSRKKAIALAQTYFVG